MSQLATWAESVAKDVRSNKLKLKFTYNEFIERVSKIPKETDFSRLARYHAAQRKEQPIDLSKDEDRTLTGSESTFEKERLKPIELDETFKENSYTQDVFTTTTNNKRSTAGAQNRFNLDDDKKREATKESKNNSKTSPIESSCTNNQMNTNENTNETTRAVVEYHKWTTGHLKNKCTEFGIARNGTKDELIARLLDETNRPPEVYLLRKNRALYVPARVDVAATAILVTLQIKQDLAQAGANYAGETKDEIVALADPLNIKKDPWCGGTTQTGPYHYDGWASMGKLKESDMVIFSRSRFRLSTTGNVSGIKLARAMHIWCHQKGICRCVEEGYEFNLK